MGLSLPGLAALGAGALKAADAASAPAPAGDLGARTYNVRDFGAKGDGTTLDTAAVQAAIEACAKDQGGTVLVPAGDFVIGTVALRSHVTLRVAAKGRLLGSEDIAHYHAGEGIPPGNGNIVLISAADCENVTIEGPGTIDGNGGGKFYTGHGDATGPGDDRSKAYVQRPHLFAFHNCTNLVLRNVFLTRSAYHCCRILECSRVRLEGVRIHNRANVNNDGFHIDASEYVHISNCDVACQDDACSLFGSNKFITVTNCTFSTRWSVFRFGGGEAENITVSNCLIYETYGCPIKIAMGRGSRAENITFSNLILKDVTGPITVGLNDRSRRRPNAQGAQQARPPGIVRNITFSNIRATVVTTAAQQADMPFPPKPRPGETRTCIVLNGAGEAVLENITLSDVHAVFAGGGTAEEAANRKVPEVAGEYFEIGTPPAYGLFARGVKGLTLDNVRLETKQPDLRPAVVFDRVTDAAVSGLNVQGNLQAESALRLVGTRDALFTATRVLTPAALAVQVEGASSANILFQGGDLSKAAAPAKAAAGASDSAVKVS